MTKLSRDVLIVGAGATGLTAATRLRAAGLSVIVLEARDRVGGRLWTSHVDGQLLELGGQWVSPDQTALIETIDGLGLTLYPRYRDGDSVYLGADNVPRRYTGDLFPVSPRTQSELQRLIGLLDGLVAEVDPAAPWNHPRAAELDTVSFLSWLEQTTNDVEARDNVAMFIAAAMITKPAHSFSVLQALLMAASAGSFSNLVDPDVILNQRVEGGLQQVALRLAKVLGDDVLLGAPVTSITWSESGVTAYSAAAGLTVDARHAIIAVPPHHLSRIEYIPALPALRQQVMQHQSMGLVIKVHATYDTPFWRSEGLSGTAFGPYEVVHEAYDNTNHGESQGTLVGFVASERADALLGLSAHDRRERILASLARYYGPKALHPSVYFESDWAADHWTQGAYATSFDLGGLTRYGALQVEPVGPLRFGSSDIAAHGYQHVDGAIRVGRRLADEITAEITAETTDALSPRN